MIVDDFRASGIAAIAGDFRTITDEFNRRCLTCHGDENRSRSGSDNGACRSDFFATSV